MYAVYIQHDPTSLINELYGFISCWYVGRHANNLLFNHASLPSIHVPHPHLLSTTQLEYFSETLKFYLHLSTSSPLNLTFSQPDQPHCHCHPNQFSAIV